MFRALVATRDADGELRVPPGLQKSRLATGSDHRRISAADVARIRTQVSVDGCGDEPALYSRLVDQLLVEGAYDDALALANATLPGGAPDTVLRAFIKYSADMPAVAAAVLQLRDKAAAAVVVLEHIKQWDIDTGVDLLRKLVAWSQSAPECMAADAAAALQSKYDELKLVQAVMRAGVALPRNSLRVKWLALASRMESSPQAVVEELVSLESGEFELARQVASRYGALNMMASIERDSIAALLGEGKFSAAMHQLNAMHDSGVSAARFLIDSVAGLLAKHRLYLVDFLLQTPPELGVTPKERARLEQRKLGIRVLSLMSETQQRRFASLEDSPALIVETLLMNEEVASLSAVFSALGAELGSQQGLIMTYALKALALPTDDAAAAARVRKRWALRGNPAADDEVRGGHYYASAPNLQLGKALFSLCPDVADAAHAVVGVCEGLSEQLRRVEAVPIATPDADADGGPPVLTRLQAASMPANVIDLVQRLLMFAKSLFTRLYADALEAGSTAFDPEGVSMCDSYLSYVELMKQMFAAGCTTRASLRDFGNPTSVRLVVDALVREDRMQLAIDVATKTGLDPSTTWARWGLNLIRLGNYEEARRKLRFCLARPGGTSPSKRQASGAGEASRTLTEVLATLERPAPLSLEFLEVAMYTFVGEPRPGAMGQFFAQSAELNAPVSAYSNLNSVRLAEARFYLGKYGTPVAEIEFLMRHGLLRDALNVVVASADVPPLAFVKHVVEHVVEFGRLDEMQTIMRDIDPSLNEFTELLVASCAYLSKHAKPVALYELQVFMGDHVRAALSCIHLFLHAPSARAQYGHMERAVGHFEAALAQRDALRAAQRQAKMASAVAAGGELGFSISRPVDTHDPTDQIMDKATMTQNVRRGRLQLEILAHYAETNEAAPYNLFGRTKERCQLAEELLVRDAFSLASRIMAEFSLPSVRILSYSAARMAASGSGNAVKSVDKLLRNIKGTVPDAEWNAVLLAVIQTFASQGKVKVAEKYVKQAIGVATAVSGYIECGKYKAAYLLAVKHHDVDEVRRLRQYAVAAEPKIANLCDKYLAQHL